MRLVVHILQRTETKEICGSPGVEVNFGLGGLYPEQIRGSRFSTSLENRFLLCSFGRVWSRV